MGRINCVIYDLFHTLVDPEDFRPKEFLRAEVVAEILDLDKPEFKAFWERTQKARMSTPRAEVDYVREFATKAGRVLPESKYREADDALGRYQDIAILNPREEVLDSIRLLRTRGYRLGLLSNTYERDVRQWSNSPLAPFFDAVCFSHQSERMKPEKEAYDAILGQLGVNPSDCAYVGDGGGRELVGAREAGFAIVVFMKRFVSRNGLRTKEELDRSASEADFTVGSHWELCDLLADLQ